MKVVYSSGKMVSYLLVVLPLVAIAFGSDKIEHSSGLEEGSTSQPDLISLKQQVNALWTHLATMEITGGAVYTRWGRTVCNTGSDVVYIGVAGGSFYNVYGGGSNYLCLSKDPIWGVYNESAIKHSKLYGSEYQYPTSFGLENNNGQSLNDHDVPCVVCQSQTKTSVVMIAGRNQCYCGWHAEYAGYLMGGNDEQLGRSTFICMDESPEALPGGDVNHNGALFYNVKGVCGSLPCPPYIPEREITCVVCTK